MKNYILSGFFSLTAQLLFGQTTDTVRFTLQEAMLFAEQHRTDMKAEQLNTQIAAEDIRRAKNGRLPEISGSASIRYNTQLQKTVLPAGFGGSSESQELAFGTRNNTSIGVDLTQPLYKPTLGADQRIAMTQVAIEQEKWRQKQQDLRSEVAAAWYNVLYHQKQLELARKSAAHYQLYRDFSQKRFAAGDLLQTDLLQADLDLGNARNTEKRAENSLAQAFQTLRFSLHLDDNQAIVLLENIKIEDAPAGVDKDLNLQLNQTERPELAQLRLKQDLYQLKSDKSVLEKRPTVSFFGNYTWQYQDKGFNYFNGNGSAFNYVGIRASIPIFSQNKNNVNIAENKIRQAQIGFNLEHTRASLENDRKQALTKLADALNALQNAQKSAELSQQIFENQQKQFEIGTFTYANILSYQRTLDTTESNLLSALYDYYVALINWEKVR